MTRAEKTSEFRGLIEEASAQGWVISQTRKGHWRFRPPGDKPIVVFSGSPGDWRAIKNFVARLRRSGFRTKKSRKRR